MSTNYSGIIKLTKFEWCQIIEFRYKMAQQTFLFPFEHTLSIQTDDELARHEVLTLLTEVAGDSVCLFIENDDGINFPFWNLGLSDDGGDFMRSMSIIKRKIHCLHLDALLDTLQEGYDMHIVCYVDDTITHHIITIAEPLTRYHHVVYKGTDEGGNCIVV